MAFVLKARPVSVQVRIRGFLVPPRYDLYRVEVSGATATALAEAYRLKSTDIIVNQSASSNRYLSCRHVFQGEPFRYIDVHVGLDEIEVFFSNPATIEELLAEVERAFSIVGKHLRPTMKGMYFEANLHCETDAPGAQAFMNEAILPPSGEGATRKGFALSKKISEDMAKFQVEVSDSVPDGLYVLFVFLSSSAPPDTASIANLLTSVVTEYRKLQSIASVQIQEP